MNPMIFLNVGWMRKYRGLTGDTIIGGGSYIQETGYGHEIFNFEPFEGNMYGFVQVTGSIDLTRIGGNTFDDSRSGILTVWVAREPTGGTFIIGWYTNATVYKELQLPPEGSNRAYEGDLFEYRVKAKQESCKLLNLDQRVFNIPRGVRGGMGQANIWYADQPSNAQFREDVWKYISEGKLSEKSNRHAKFGQPHQPDAHKRKLIEKVAVEKTIYYYEKLGYIVNSVERDNVGWDLEATNGGRKLRIEVKGLSHSELLIELTPNEYDNMKMHQHSYRISVVTDTLKKNPLLRVFSYSPESHNWEDDDENQLIITEIIGARMNLNEIIKR